MWDLLLRVFVAGLLASSTSVGPSYAQADPETLLEAWRTSQEDALRDVVRVEMDEVATWEIDGQFGVRTRTTWSRLTGTPGVNDWVRALDSLWVDGAPITTQAYDEAQQRWQRLLGPIGRAAAEGSRVPAVIPAGVEPVGTVQDDPTAPGLVRVEAAAAFERGPRGRGPRRGPPVERATFWFEADQPILRRARYVLRGPGGNAVTLTLAYDRVAGVDVPAEMTMDGLLRTQRRLRAVTMLVRGEVTYHNPVFTPAP
ncbi:MAG: hypothetical protein AAGI71_16275 [Bacteroidota bacterium]